MNIRRKIYDREEFRSLHTAQNTLDMPALRGEPESWTGGPGETSKNLDRGSHGKDADGTENDKPSILKRASGK